MYNKTLHVFGGRYGNYKFITSETINVDGVVSGGPYLTEAVYGHAITPINDTVSLLSGGSTSGNSYSTKTWYYNHDSETFTTGPYLLGGRYRHGSAISVDKVTKAKIAIVTGGWNGNYMDSTELLIKGQWKTGTIHRGKQDVLICSSVIFVLGVVYDQNHYFGLGPIQKPKP